MQAGPSAFRSRTGLLSQDGSHQEQVLISAVSDSPERQESHLSFVLAGHAALGQQQDLLYHNANR